MDCVVCELLLSDVGDGGGVKDCDEIVLDDVFD